MDRDLKDEPQPVRLRPGRQGTYQAAGTVWAKARGGVGVWMSVVGEQRGGGPSGRAWEKGIWQPVKQAGPNPAGPTPRPRQERLILLLSAVRSHQKDLSRRAAHSAVNFSKKKKVRLPFEEHITAGQEGTWKAQREGGGGGRRGGFSVASGRRTHRSAQQGGCGDPRGVPGSKLRWFTEPSTTPTPAPPQATPTPTHPPAGAAWAPAWSPASPAEGGR